MDNVVRRIIFFISLLLFIPNISAFEICEMSEDYQKWLSLTDEEKSNTIKPEYCQELYKDSNNSKPSISASNYFKKVSINTRIYNSLSASTSQSRYSSIDDGYVTTPKNQLATNSCWAFAGVSLIETAALKDGLSYLDLSERHIEYAITRNAFIDGVNNNGFNRVLDSGGNSYFTASYYFRHEGPILENSMPYQNSNNKISIDTMPTDKAILDVGNYSVEYYSAASGCATNQISSIKEKIVQYGSVGASIYYSDYYLKNNKYYNNYDEDLPNHAVTIVGWDDSISASNFSGNPTLNGAWIVKNSWGPNWGDNGYFYISYSDMRICNNPYTFSQVKINSYDNAYSASDTLANYSFYNADGVFYMSSKFTKMSNETEYLDKISVEFNAGNVYEVYLALDNNLADQSTWKSIASGYIDTAGIKSFTFSPIAVTGDYTVIVKFVSGFFPMMCKTINSTDLHYYMNIASGKNYYSFDTNTWADLKNVEGSNYNGCEPVIYAYTKNASSVNTSFNIDSITSSSSPVYLYSDDYFTINVSSTNVVSYDLFKIKILNTNNIDVTNYFDITNNLANGKVIIKPNSNAKTGNYTFEISYNNVKKTTTFSLSAVLESSNYSIDGEYIYVNLKKEKELSKTSFINNINTHGNSYNLLSSSDNDVTDSVTYIGTGMKFKVGNKVYIVVLKGDVSGDGKIMSNDALMISRSIVYLHTLSDAAKLAADVTGDLKIMSNDSLIISRFLVGLHESL